MTAAAHPSLIAKATREARRALAGMDLTSKVSKISSREASPGGERNCRRATLTRVYVASSRASVFEAIRVTLAALDGAYNVRVQSDHVAVYRTH
jgi:hypothetical protein